MVFTLTKFTFFGGKALAQYLFVKEKRLTGKTKKFQAANLLLIKCILVSIFTGIGGKAVALIVLAKTKSSV